MYEKEMHRAVCADFGKDCEVPFKPDEETSGKEEASKSPPMSSTCNVIFSDRYNYEWAKTQAKRVRYSLI